MNNFIEYLENNNIKFESVNENVVKIDNNTYIYEKPLVKKHFDEEFNLVHQDKGYDYHVILFGGRYYRIECGKEDDFELDEIKYIGEADCMFPSDAFLGIHGGYELLSGSRSYKDWCKKAKFLGVSSLGLCEKNTLAGVLKFQQECQKQGIKPVIGASYAVNRGGEKYIAKLYVKDEIGWLNLLELNYLCNVVNKGFILESELLSHLDNLTLVIDPKSIKFDDLFPIDLSCDFYYQLDTIEYKDDMVDVEYLENLKKFVNSDYKPCAITDAYYLDKEDAFIKSKLEVMKKEFDFKSENQYFKPKEDYLMELSHIVSDEDRLMKLYEEAVLNERLIANSCNFLVDTNNRHLPEYDMTPEEEELYGDKETMFWSLIEDGLNKLYPDYTDEHLERIEKEVAVLEMGGVKDYFLTTRDIINASRNEGILIGIARGSAGGSIVSYLLGITKIDPLKFGLIFERFLNAGRVTVSLPDIDTDFEGKARPWIKSYIENRFGDSQVSSVGTYDTMQLKAAIKDLYRQVSSDFKEANIITSLIDKNDKTITDLFKRSTEEPKLKKFIQSYPSIFYELPLVLGQPCAKGVHACAMIIVPKEKPSKHFFPTYYHNKSNIVLTEWEGGELDSAGFLKMDILSTTLLDKFKDTLNRIEANGKTLPDIYNLPLDDGEVYKYCSMGWNSDIFQLGTSGLSAYSQKLKPDCINDLIACIALYRPGAMENGFHEAYVRRKNGEEEVSYVWGTEDILKNTYGLMVYQEQCMRICTDIAGFDLVTADDIRSALSKKIMEKLLSFEGRFMDGALGNGCPEADARFLWDSMVEFAKYSFNASHSAAYAIEGYIGQWLKVHYPLEFWSTAFTFADEKKIPRFLSEVLESKAVKMLPPTINRSGIDLDGDSDGIYWALCSIKGIAGKSKENPDGGKAAVQIIKDRDENGDYVDLKDFVKRHNFKGSKVNKRVYEGLILAGAFDDVNHIEYPRQRINLLNEYWELSKAEINEDKSWYHKNRHNAGEDWLWLLEQKRLSGFANFNYKQLCLDHLGRSDYITNGSMRERIDKATGCLGGVVSDAIERSGARGKYCKFTIESNYSIFNGIIWTEQWEDMEIQANDMIGSIMLFHGDIRYDERYTQSNQLVASKNGNIKFLK